MEERQNRDIPEVPTPAQEPAPAPVPEAEAPSDGTGTGYLIVRVSTARGAIPLEGARVDIRTYEDEKGSDPVTRGDIVASLVTGRDGCTVRIPLPTTPAAASESPGASRPYARYSADVFLVGYRRQCYLGIPIFDGITSLQSAFLIPLPEDGSGGTLPEDTQYFPEAGYPEL